MLDFFQISRKHVKKDVVEIYPTFIVKSKSTDLMIRGRDFYAVWDEENKIWSQDEQKVLDQVDAEVEKVYLSCVNNNDDEITYIPKYMWNSDSGIIDKWHKYVQKQCRDNYHNLNEKIIFANSKTSKRDYASKKLNYDLENGDISAWNDLISILYSPEEKDKIEWAIGSVVANDSKKIQKCIYLYGGPKTGKSTVLDIIQAMFDGYYCIFDAKELGNGNSSFALESFKDNPLVGIQQDGDLSKIDDNTRLNSIISHDTMEVNEKFKSKYTVKFNAFLFMASNKMVKITDAKSGLMRRIIDVSPTGKTVPFEKYTKLKNKILDEELGHIAKHCLDRYNELGMNYYSKYVPMQMIIGTNEFYNFIQDLYFEQEIGDRVSLKSIWAMYKKWCEEANIKYPMSMNAVRNELMNYFETYEEDSYSNGKHERSIFSGFHREKFKSGVLKEGLIAIPNKKKKPWLDLKDYTEFDGNILDKEFADCQAQYGDDKPDVAWSRCKFTLKDIDTSKTHYVRPPSINYITIDFDKKDANGNKSLEMNLEAAESWPPTYAEVSKGGQGLHLEYLYSGDAEKLASVFDEDVEIKVFTGKSSLRRRLSKCNDIPIATISDLPLKKEVKMVNTEGIKNEKQLRKFIFNCFKKQHHGHTTPEVDYIYKVLENAYNSGLKYDISDLEPDITAFANNSSHQAQKCLRIVSKMHFKSDDIFEPEPYEAVDGEEPPIVFFDVEVFPNLFVLCYKFVGEKAVGMINPSGRDIEKLCRYRLVGFYNRKYDNHILYARMHDYSNLQLFHLSSKLINEKQGYFGGAYNLSYADIYDFAVKKQGLKKWEIELGIHHQELGLPWDKKVPEELWDTVVEYCVNDVEATEAVWNACHADFMAREILADLSGLTVNDTNRQHITKIIFGDEKKPNLVYTNLATGEQNVGR